MTRRAGRPRLIPLPASRIATAILSKQQDIGLTDREAAEEAGVTMRAWRGWRDGTRLPEGRRATEALAAWLGVDVARVALMAVVDGWERVAPPKG